MATAAVVLVQNGHSSSFPENVETCTQHERLDGPTQAVRCIHDERPQQIPLQRKVRVIDIPCRILLNQSISNNLEEGITITLQISLKSNRRYCHYLDWATRCVSRYRQAERLQWGITFNGTMFSMKVSMFLVNSKRPRAFVVNAIRCT